MAALRSTPPPDLDAAGCAAWKRYRALLVERTVWDASGPELSDECVRSLQDARLARERIAARVAALGDVPEARWVKGSRGQWVESPDAVLIRHALDQAQSLAAALLLSPASARCAGLTADSAGEANPFASFAGDELAPRRKAK